MEVTQMPNSKESEYALLGSILINPDMYAECAPIISAGDFFTEGNRTIWTAIKTLADKKRDIDIVTVAEAISGSGIDGSYLNRLIGMSPNSYNAKSYAEEIRDKSRRRKQVEIAQRIVKGAYNGGVNVSDAVSDLVSTSDLKKKSETLASGLSEYYDFIESRFNDPREVWGIPTTYKEFDKSTGGLHKGHVLMISGAPGAGKSILASAMVLKSAMNGAAWAIYSLEMSRQDLINRWVGMLTGLSEDKLSSGTFPKDKWDDITRAIETLDNLPIHINDIPAITTTDISADIARIQATEQLDAVLVDYLELLGDTAESANEATARKSRRFREVCRSKNLAGLIIQSMTKEGIGAATGGVVQGTSGKKSFASAQSAIIGVRGPADVGHDADTIFMLVVDPEDSTGQTVAALPAKKRHGSGSKRPIRFRWHESAPMLVPSDKEIYFKAA